MLLEDFNKIVLNETPAADMGDNIPDDFPLNGVNSRTMTTAKIPKRYFLGYVADDLDASVQKYFQIGFDKRGTLGVEGNYYIWIGESTETSDGIKSPTGKERLEFYKAIYSTDISIDSNEDFVEFVNDPPTATPSLDNLKSWADDSVGQDYDPNNGSWYRIKDNGRLLPVQSNSLTFRKLMAFSGFADNPSRVSGLGVGERNLELLMLHKQAYETRDQQDRAEELSTPLKDKTVVMFPNTNVKFEYRGEPPSGNWFRVSDNIKIPRGSPEHALLMRVKGKQPDGKTEIKPEEKNGILKRLGQMTNGQFGDAIFGQYGQRFRMPDKQGKKLPILARVLGSWGDYLGAKIGQIYKDNAIKNIRNKFDRFGDLFDEANPDSLVNKLPEWSKQPDGWFKLTRFFKNVKEEYNESVGRPKDAELSLDSEDLYETVLFRLIDIIEEYASAKFKEGDQVKYIPQRILRDYLNRGRKDGDYNFFNKFKSEDFKIATVICQDDLNLKQVVVQDLGFHESLQKIYPMDIEKYEKPPKGIGPYTPTYNLIPTNINSREVKKFLELHGFTPDIWFENIGYDLYYQGNRAPKFLTKTDYLNTCKAVYKGLNNGKDWRIKQRRQIMNLMGVFFIEPQRLRSASTPPQSVFAEFDRVLKDEARKKDEQDRKEGKPTPQEEAEWYAPFILGQEVFFIAQENARVPGEITRGVIVEPNMKTIDNPDRDTNNIYVTVRTADSPKVGFPIAKNRLKLSAEELIDRDEQLKQSAQPYLFKKDGTLYGQKMSMLIDPSTKKPIRIFADGPGKGRKVPDDAPMNIVDEYANDEIFDSPQPA